MMIESESTCICEVLKGSLIFQRKNSARHTLTNGENEIGKKRVYKKHFDRVPVFVACNSNENSDLFLIKRDEISAHVQLRHNELVS